MDSKKRKGSDDDFAARKRAKTEEWRVVEAQFAKMQEEKAEIAAEEERQRRLAMEKERAQRIAEEKAEAEAKKAAEAEEELARARAHAKQQADMQQVAPMVFHRPLKACNNCLAKGLKCEGGSAEKACQECRRAKKRVFAEDPTACGSGGEVGGDCTGLRRGGAGGGVSGGETAALPAMVILAEMRDVVKDVLEGLRVMNDVRKKGSAAKSVSLLDTARLAGSSISSDEGEEFVPETSQEAVE